MYAESWTKSIWTRTERCKRKEQAMIQVRCPHCRRVLQVLAHQSMALFDCPSCHRRFRVPATLPPLPPPVLIQLTPSKPPSLSAPSHPIRPTPAPWSGSGKPKAVGVGLIALLGLL